MKIRLSTLGNRAGFKYLLMMLMLAMSLLPNLASSEPEQSLDDVKITLKLKDVSLQDAFIAIEEKSSFRFITNTGLLNQQKKVSASFRERSIKEVLSTLLNGTGLTFTQINSNIVIRSKELSQDLMAPVKQNVALTVTGVVTDENETPLPGVNVLVKGSGSGTVTDVEGKYSLTVEDGNSSLIFSYIGYTREEVAINNREKIDVILMPDIQSLSEVVVTALGIEKDKDALSYSVAEVEGSEFTQAREVNLANALSGKIAGVNATSLASGPGGSSRVIIRGNGSLNGNNQPLYVINGMPIDNTTVGGGASTNGGGMNVDRGDGIGGINPDDIESISVLKGGTAAALYGSRAANGVILITTKKGKAQKGIGVEYNTTLTLETPAVFPHFQYQYGQGVDGQIPTSIEEAVSTGRLSFGAPMNGQDYIQFDGESRPYSPVSAKQNIKNFYQTGTNFVNTVALTGGSENINYRFSLSNTDANSILPNSTFNKKIANLNVNGYLGERISIEAVAQYNIEKANNRPSAGDANGNPNWAVYMLANTVDIRNLAPGYNENGEEIQWNPVPYANNAYFVTNRFQNFDEKNRFIGQANIKYDIMDNLFVKGSVSRDFYSYNYTGIIPTNTGYQPLGSYQNIRANVSETNSMLTMNYTETFGNFGLNALIGGNQRKYVYDQTTIEGSEFVIPYFYSYTNLNTLATRPLNQTTATNSVFGSADLDYKGIAFLTLTGRQDWFSTLSTENNSIFYPSVGGSVILSEAMELPKFFSYAKLRGSWAQVGGATPDPYILNQTYSMVQGGHNGRPLQVITQNNGSNLVTNSSLRPLTSTTYEVGIETQLAEGRLGVDLTYYNRKTTDDIVQTTISVASGYNNALLNVGELSNKGVELLLTGQPVVKEKWGWNVSYNVAYNKSQVVKLADGLSTIQVANSIGNWASVHNEVGRPYGILKGYRMARNEDGEIIYNTASGYELRSDLVELGQGVPPLTMGLTNDFHYKDFTLSVLLDGKFGNKIFSTMDTYAHRFGLQEETLPGREEGLTLTGVDEEGNPYEGYIAIDGLDTYYDNQKNYSELFVYDGSFVKLRQVIFGYNLPVAKMDWLNIQSASLSFVARNLAILYRQTDNFDPESSYTSGNAQGFEAFGLPRTRSYGFNLKVKF